MANFISGIISITISVVVMANVYIATIKQVNTSAWEPSEVAMWGLLTLVGIVGLVYGVMAVFGIL